MMYAGQKIEIEVAMVDYNVRTTYKHGWANNHIRDYTFKDADGTTYKFHTTGCTGFYGVKPGDTFKMKATVKEVTDTEVKLIRCRKA